tara:strand:+ start:315 stop:530 length:216 start_codon:yes stop_codon:yes gene_type:complete
MMIEGFVIKGIIKIIQKQFKLDKIVSYVFDQNELDDRCDVLEDKVKKLEEKAHPPRDFVVCEMCKNKIKEK